MSKRLLLCGWALLIVSGILIIEFPNAEWNHAVSEFFWFYGIALFVTTLALVVVKAVRLAVRVVPPSTPGPIILPPLAPVVSLSKRPRRSLQVSAIALAIGVFGALLFGFIEHELKSSAVYRFSVARAQVSPDVAQILGHPVNVGWFATGAISESTNGGGHATLAIPLEGPKGHGTLRVQAQRQLGSWRISVLELTPAGHDSVVDLLGEQPR
jgi:hypothetical protein